MLIKPEMKRGGDSTNPFLLITNPSQFFGRQIESIKEDQWQKINKGVCEVKISVYKPSRVWKIYMWSLSRTFQMFGVNSFYAHQVFDVMFAREILATILNKLHWEHSTNFIRALIRLLQYISILMTCNKVQLTTINSPNKLTHFTFYFY